MGVPKKLINLVQVYLKDTRDRMKIGGAKCWKLLISIAELKQEYALLPLLFNLVLEYVIKEVQKSRNGLQLNGITQLFTYTDDVTGG